jgi:hypothetical protein
MSRRDLINRIASLEGSRDYWLQDRPEMTATDWANLCEEDADELRELYVQLDEPCPTCGAVDMDAAAWDRFTRTGNCDPYCQAEAMAYCQVCACKLMPSEEGTCRSCARAEP